MTSLGSATWTQLATAALRSRPANRTTVLVPLGSCEQHGPHLPLDTDTRIAVAICELAAERHRSVLVAPPLSFGASWEHHGFPGLLSLNTSVLTAVLVELAHSANWADGLVFVNGHGGNIEGSLAARRVLQGEGHTAAVWSPTVATGGVVGDAHAGRTETSIMLALDRSHVHLESAEPGWTGHLDTLRSQPVIALSPNGVLGDPTGASAEEGHQLLSSFADQLCAVIDQLGR